MTIIAENSAMAQRAKKCPTFDWCDHNHNDRRSSATFHMQSEPTGREPGKLPIDIVVDEDETCLEIVESIEWTIPLNEVTEVANTLRKEADRLEERAAILAASARRRADGGSL